MSDDTPAAVIEMLMEDPDDLDFIPPLAPRRADPDSINNNEDDGNDTDPDMPELGTSVEFVLLLLVFECASSL